MRANPFESQLERLARTLTEQSGVQVVCQGDNAWTDGTQIVLPSVPTPMDSDLEKCLIGYLDHEMGHVAFSDFGVAEQFARKHPGFDGLLNVIEDALIERRAMDRWPGVRHNLDMMFRQIRGRVAQLIRQRGPFDRFCTAVYLRLSHHGDLMGLDRELAGYEDLLARFPQIGTTHEAGELAELILQRWQQRAAQRQQRRQPSQTGQSEKGANSKSGLPSSSSGQESQGPEQDTEQQPGTDTDKGKGNPGSQADGTSQSDSAKADEAAGTPGGTDSSSGQPAPSTCAQTVDGSDSSMPGPSGGSGSGGLGRSLIGEALVEAINQAVQHADSSRQYRVFTKEHDRIAVVPTAADNDVHTLLENGQDIVRRLRRGLTNALRSAEKRWWREDQLRGSLSPRALHRLCMDRSGLDVFRTRCVVQGQSTAVSILLDASGSMTTRKMEVARSAVRVLLEALADLKIAAEALTFTTGNEVNTTQISQLSGQDASKLRERYARLANLEIGLICRFGEPVKAALRRLPGVRGSGLTPLGEAMQIAAGRLIARPENRRILLVLTDGKAGCEGCGEAAMNHARHVAGRIARAGIEPVGVGILDESIREVVADSIVIHQLEDLPAQLCKLLGRALRKGLCHVG